MTVLTFAETPKTRKAFLEKFHTDHVFKARAEYTGFRVIGENVVLPNGTVATPRTKQPRAVEVGSIGGFRGPPPHFTTKV